MILRSRAERLRAIDSLRLLGRPRILWPALALLALIAGLAAGWLLPARTPREGSPEVTFGRNMAAHHDQAVGMALIMNERSTDPRLRTFALDIVLTQQAQIGQFQGWLQVWGLPLSRGTPMAGMSGMMGLATQAQINELRTLPVAAAEVSFLQLMIRHHQMAITMARDVLQKTRRPEVVRLANAIVAGQQSEIEYMRQLLKQRGASADTPKMEMPQR